MTPESIYVITGLGRDFSTAWPKILAEIIRSTR